jgi:uncharacterized protein YecA (UPF0149 family)
LPDPNANDKTVLTKFQKNLTQNQLIDHLIELDSLKDRLFGKSERLSGERLQPVWKNLVALQTYSSILTAMVFSGHTEEDLCGCLSGKKYSRCHGQKVVELLSSPL